jgi:hypothetical protein
VTPQRPRVYLVVILPLLIAGVLVPAVLVAVYAAGHGFRTHEVPGLNALLIGLPAFFLWIPLALWVANVILKSIPSLRRMAETYAAQAARPGYEDSQKQLLKAAAWAGVVCIPLMILGWWL